MYPTRLSSHAPLTCTHALHIHIDHRSGHPPCRLHVASSRRRDDAQSVRPAADTWEWGTCTRTAAARSRATRPPKTSECRRRSTPRRTSARCAETLCDGQLAWGQTRATPSSSLLAPSPQAESWALHRTELQDLSLLRPDHSPGHGLGPGLPLTRLRDWDELKRKSRSLGCQRIQQPPNQREPTATYPTTDRRKGSGVRAKCVLLAPYG